MGKQFRFIMDKYDENRLFDFIKKSGLVFIEERNQNPKLVNELPENWFQLILYKESFGEIKYRKVMENRIYIDRIASPVIEFCETIIRNKPKEISRGRLWLEMKYYNDEGDLETKDESVNDWYKELSKWVKKNLKCVKIEVDGRTDKEYVSESLVGLVEDYYLEIDLKKANEYWKNKKYDQAKELFEKHFEKLSDSQLRKLEYIRKHK